MESGLLDESISLLDGDELGVDVLVFGELDDESVPVAFLAISSSRSRSCLSRLLIISYSMDVSSCTSSLGLPKFSTRPLLKHLTYLNLI